MSEPTSTRLGRDIRSALPPASSVDGIVRIRPDDVDVWQLAAPHLTVRNNDSHTLYAYGLARALLRGAPTADPDVVLPAILLHDTGWSTVPDAQILDAIAPGGGRPDLVRHHEIEGARLARQVLDGLGRTASVVDRVVAIIDGHDSRSEALSLEDALVKDADKLWRVTPHGLSTVQGWFGLDHAEALRITGARVQNALHTEQAQAMARALMAVASIDDAPQRKGLI